MLEIFFTDLVSGGVDNVIGRRMEFASIAIHNRARCEMGIGSMDWLLKARFEIAPTVAIAGRLLSIWRRSGGVNLADFPVPAGLPIWRQPGANLARVWPIWRDSLQLEIACRIRSGEMTNVAI